MTTYLQHPLDLKFKPALGNEDFFLSHCNQVAVNHLHAWPTWPHRACLLWGPEASGKTHLLHLWQKLTKAQVIEGVQVTQSHVSDQANHPHALAIDAIEDISEEVLLLQLMNIAKENNAPLLMTSRLSPSHLPFRLPDLTSRLKGLVSMEILPPDDELITMLIMKLCHDQQLTLTAPLLDYILPRTRRTYGFVQAFVDKLRHLSLSAKRQPSIPMAKMALSELEGDAEGK